MGLDLKLSLALRYSIAAQIYLGLLEHSIPGTLPNTHTYTHTVDGL